MNILAPIGLLYGLVMQVRNAMYDLGILRVHDLGAKTISVGNITAGGTGKTPLVRLIAEILANHGEKVCILTRGYGRKNENERVVVCSRDTMVADPEIAGDEPVELARNLLGKAIIIADADRVAAAKWAKENFGVTAFILDDAFQHRRARRDLDIVCVDATNPFGNGRILPSGRLRESVNAIERAYAIVITRSNEGENIEELKKRLAKFNNSAQIFKASTTNRKFVELNEFHGKAQSKQDDYNGEAVAFAGIANPKSFFRSIKRSGIRLVGECEFEDHFKYTQKDVERIEGIAKTTNARCLITTPKDAVKLGKLEFSMPCYVAEIETVIDDPDRFRQFVLSV